MTLRTLYPLLIIVLALFAIVAKTAGYDDLALMSGIALFIAISFVPAVFGHRADYHRKDRP